MKTIAKNSNLSIIAATLFFIVTAQTHAGVRCHVSPNGNENGSSWSLTMSLSDALADVNCAQIWVKQGTYYPSEVNDRSASFLINRPLELYGGFEGDETNLAERRPGRYPSILSGNIGALNHSDDNSYHVIHIDGTTTNGTITRDTIIDGFTVRDGYADGQANPRDNEGGGLLCYGKGAGKECSPTLSNITFYNNHAFMGGAIMNYGYAQGVSSPLITHSTFAYNSSGNNGGAIFNHGFSGSNRTDINNVTFYANSAFSGGAIYGNGFSGDNSPTIIHSTFINNRALQSGGAIYMFANENNSSVTTVINSLFWNNQQQTADTIALNNVTATIDYSLYSNPCPENAFCEGIITGDPILKPLMLDYGYTPTAVPTLNGAAYNTAKDDDCTYTDQRGEIRPATGCDIGAVEINVLDADLIYSHGFQVF